MAWRRVRALERSWLDLESKRKVVVACRGGQLDQLGVRLLVPPSAFLQPRRETCLECKFYFVMRAATVSGCSVSSLKFCDCDSAMACQSGWHWQSKGDRKGTGKSDDRGEGYGWSQWQSNFGGARRTRTNGTSRSRGRFLLGLSMSHQWSPPPLAPGGPQPAPGRVAATAAATIEGAIVSSVRESARDMTVAWVSDAFSNLVNGVKRVVSCGETAVSEPAQYFCLGLALASLFWLRYFCALRMSFMAEAQGGSSLCGSSARSAQAVVTGGDHGSPRLGCSDREDWLSQLENRRVPSRPAPLVVI